MRKIGNQIKFYMDRERKNAARMSEISGITQAGLSRILSGKSNTDDETLSKICHALNIQGPDKAELVIMASASRAASGFADVWEWIYKRCFKSNSEKDVLQYIEAKQLDVDLLGQCLEMVEGRYRMTGTPATPAGRAELTALVYDEVSDVVPAERTKDQLLKLVVNNTR
jgi:transcriptional regulator with XRE-family HTH domain